MFNAWTTGFLATTYSLRNASSADVVAALIYYKQQQKVASPFSFIKRKSRSMARKTEFHRVALGLFKPSLNVSITVSTANEDLPYLFQRA